MGPTEPADFIICPDDLILITGAAGFIGSRVVASLLRYGFRNLRCFARHHCQVDRVGVLTRGRCDGARVEVFRGNLLSREDCDAAAQNVALIVHLAASRGAASFPDAFLNSVVTTRNLLEACVQHPRLRRFVSISSFTVYTNRQKCHGRLLDESCPIERHPELRGDAYCFAKVRQDEIVADYGKRFGIPYVLVRPGYVYGPGNEAIPGRVGIATFGLFLHLGGANTVPLTYVDNCAEAIALAGLTRNVDGEVFNVVDDDLPSSRQFLRLYKQNVGRFTSLYVPHFVSYAFSYLWERYSTWSQGQLPPVFNRRQWHAYWKKTQFSNGKLKTRLGWTQRVPTGEAFRRYFRACRDVKPDA